MGNKEIMEKGFSEILSLLEAYGETEDEGIIQEVKDICLENVPMPENPPNWRG